MTYRKGRLMFRQTSTLCWLCGQLEITTLVVGIKRIELYGKFQLCGMQIVAFRTYLRFRTVYARLSFACFEKKLLYVRVLKNQSMEDFTASGGT